MFPSDLYSNSAIAILLEGKVLDWQEALETDPWSGLAGIEDTPPDSSGALATMLSPAIEILRSSADGGNGQGLGVTGALLSQAWAPRTTGASRSRFLYASGPDVQPTLSLSKTGKRWV